MTGKEQVETWGDENILHLDLGADYMCKSSPSCPLKICAVYYVKVIPQLEK